MANLELDNGRGLAFKLSAEDRKSDSYPNFSGQIKTPTGEVYDVAFWVKETKNKKQMLSIRVNEPYHKQNDDTPTKHPASNSGDGSDDLPF